MVEVVYFLACYGLTFALCDSQVLARPRYFLRERSSILDGLLGCYFCTGFWVSAAWYVLLLSGLLDGLPEVREWPVLASSGLAHAFAGATVCYALDAAVVALEVLAGRPRAEERTGKKDGP